jgi:hypothetical protein
VPGEGSEREIGENSGFQISMDWTVKTARRHREIAPPNRRYRGGLKQSSNRAAQRIYPPRVSLQIPRRHRVAALRFRPLQTRPAMV